MAVFGNFWRKVPIVNDLSSSQEQEMYPTISLYENCIQFELQRDQNYHVDLRQTCLAVKLIFFKGHGYETYNTKEVKEEHKEGINADEEATTD